jgi:hypothetical protein
MVLMYSGPYNDATSILSQLFLTAIAVIPICIFVFLRSMLCRDCTLQLYVFVGRLLEVSVGVVGKLLRAVEALTNENRKCRTTANDDR